MRKKGNKKLSVMLMLVMLLVVGIFFCMESNFAYAGNTIVDYELENMEESINSFSIESYAVTGAVFTYYVGGEGASDFNDGITGTTSFATIQKAVVEIESKGDVGSIMILSDIALDKPIVIKDSISMRSNDSVHEISRSSVFESYGEINYDKSMVIVFGNLNLGDSSNNSAGPDLIFDGGFYKGKVAPAEIISIKTTGCLNMYAGVSLQNNHNGGGVYNSGIFNMYGGIINDNSAVVTGGVSNVSSSAAVFTMSGGSITNNHGMIGGVNIGYGTFILKGGLIAFNDGTETGGVSNRNDDGTMIIEQGDIMLNHGDIYGGVYNNGHFLMSGGTIHQNTSDMHLTDGIYNDSTGIFTLGGNAKVENNDIWLNGTTLSINGTLVGEGTVATIVPAEADAPVYNIGTSIAMQNGEYVIRPENLNKIELKDTRYSFDREGKILKKLQDSEITFADSNKKYYYLELNNPKFVVMDGTTELTEFVDYYVEYYDFSCVGTATAKINGQGNYSGQVIKTYIINKAVVEKINTPAPEPLLLYAFQNVLPVRMAELFNMTQVEVKYNGRKDYLHIEWNLTGGTFKPQGGDYTFTGSLVNNDNVDGGNVTLSAQVTVVPTSPFMYNLDDVYVRESYDDEATADELGESILPTSGINQVGSDFIAYTINWDNQTLDRTDINDSVTFTGTVTYLNPPVWLTVPATTTVTREVGINTKILVYIELKNPILDKVYDGIAVSTTPSFTSLAPYTGEYLMLYTSTGDNSYHSANGPKAAGKYKLTISTTEDDLFKGASTETFFEIFQKEVVIVPDNKTVQVGNPIPSLTYHFQEGKGLLSGDSFIVNPIVTANGATAYIAGNFTIYVDGAVINDNYKITYLYGVLSVTPTPVTDTPIIPLSGGGGFFPPSGGGGFFPPAGPSNTTPTPTPIATPTSGPIIENVIMQGLDEEVQMTISDILKEGELEVSIKLPAEAILSLANQNGSGNKPIQITLPISSESVLKKIQTVAVNGVTISVKIPNNLRENAHIEINNIIDANILAAAKEEGKDVSVKITDENGKERYSWIFTGDSLNSSEKAMRNVDLTMKVESVIDNPELNELLRNNTNSEGDDAKGLVLNFSHDGTLPSQATVRIYVGDQAGIKTGNKVFLYHYNQTQGMLELLPFSSEYVVDGDGYITIHILHCSNYVVLPQEAKSSAVTTLQGQISVTPSTKTLYFGGDTGSSISMLVKLPSTLESVKSLNEEISGSAIGAVIITYKSSSDKVASVSADGKITAKGVGTATITTIIKLYDGTTKSSKTVITVQKAYIKISKGASSIKVGDSFIFTLRGFGYNTKNVIWTSITKSILEIDNETGKAVAKAKGTTFVEARINNSVVRMKVTVK